MTVLEKLVVEEATKLKQFATKEELDNLDYEYLDGNDFNNCIYGQMTDCCNSKRAYTLIQQCCERVYEAGEADTFSGKLNGKPKELDNAFTRTLHYVSPIEKFLYKHKEDIFIDSPKIEKLVQFLKGEIDVLNFDKV
jgi:hypothetical protein